MSIDGTAKILIVDNSNKVVVLEFGRAGKEVSQYTYNGEVYTVKVLSVVQPSNNDLGSALIEFKKEPTLAKCTFNQETYKITCT